MSRVIPQAEVSTVAPAYGAGERRGLLLDAAGRLQVTGGGAGISIVSGNRTPSDAFANPTDALDSWALLGGFDPVTGWRRIRGDGNGSLRSVGADPSLTNLAPAPSMINFSAVAATGVIKASPGRLLAYSYDASAVLLGGSFFQLFDKAAVPVLGDVPALNFFVGRIAALPMAKDRGFFGPSGALGSAGIAWGLSTTPATFTAAVPLVAQLVSAVFV